MFVLEFDFVANFDVDQTLIDWECPENEKDFELEHGGVIMRGKVMTKHVERIKMHKFWGNGVVVWSKSGYSFAKAVVEKLGVKEYVHFVSAKPSWYYDDKKCEQFMGERRFLYEEK